MTRLDIALISVPFDLAKILITYGTEMAFSWVGQEPQDDREFYFEMGRNIAKLTNLAWEKQLGGEKWESH